LLFGAASKWGLLKDRHWLVALSWLHLDLALPLLTLFITIRGVDGYCSFRRARFYQDQHRLV